MTEAWGDEQLRWLAQLHEVRRREIDPSLEFEEFPQPGDSQVQLVQILRNLLENNLSPATGAQKISEWVISTPDVDKCYDIFLAYSHMMGVMFAGARETSSLQHLKILADFTVELANLPDTHNDGKTPLVFEGGSVVVLPRERIKLPCQTGSELWSGLPDFAQDISMALNDGPAGLIKHSDASEALRKAEQRYTNLSTYAALIARHHPPKGSQLNSCLHSAFAVLAFLEHGPDTPRGKFAPLAVRAAAAWITIAGQEIVELGSPATKRDYIAGSLWEAQGGANTVDVKRLRFWKARFQQLRESGGLVSTEAVEATTAAEAALDVLIHTQQEE